jgi:hypothetical protein
MAFLPLFAGVKIGVKRQENGGRKTGNFTGENGENGRHGRKREAQK